VSAKLRFEIKDGLDIPISGAPEALISVGQPVSKVALSGLDYPGLKPKMHVSPGDFVRLGQPLFSCKDDPAVSFTSPGSGTVLEVNRGARRRLETVVIRLEDDDQSEFTFDSLTGDQLLAAQRSTIVKQLLDSGAWIAFRTRPFSNVPRSDAVPHSIFVTAIDTQPLAADPRLVIRENLEAFNTGLLVLSRLTEGVVYLCTGPNWDLETGKIERLVTAEFRGPHPAGLPGTHIHLLYPVSVDHSVWHIGYQDVIAIGQLFLTGRIYTGRVVALGGDPLARPRLVRTRVGASTDDLLAGEYGNEAACRVISGSVLTGRNAKGASAYLGRYHNQVSVLAQAPGKRLFGWLGLRANAYTASATFLRKTGHRRKFSFTTARHGRYSAMLPVRVFDKVVPIDILPSSLFRALMVLDTQRAQALGCLELDEEDLALCSFVCPAKLDYGAILRQNLELIEKEG
jgi:Na+-transporting NADH:ubiquinone oxidoreductase subunit A